MTTPNQASPDGAVTIGGGEWKYGQAINEQTARSAFEMPMPSPGNMLDLLRMSLERLPIDALQPFADFLGVVDGVFTTVGEAVGAIMDSLIVRPILQTVEAFTDWVKDLFEAMGSGLLSGDLVQFGQWFNETIREPIVGTIDGFVRGILGLFGSGFNVNVVEETAISLAESIASMNAIVTKLNREAEAGSFAGTAVVVDFAGYANSSTLGSDWSQTHSGTGTGTLGITSGRARWSGSATNRSSLARYTAKVATTDYQKVGAAFATIPSTDSGGGSASSNFLYGRMNAAGNTYVYLRLMKNSWQLGCSVNGSITVFASAIFSFTPGAAYWLECGTTGGARIFRIWMNNTVIHTHTDSAAVSQLGHYHTGMGVTSFSSNYVPAQVSAFTFYDNIPPSVKGTGWRVTRTSTTTGSLVSGTNLFPASWFNTPEFISDDLVYTTASNKVKVPYDGWYSVNVIQYGDNSIGPGGGGKNRAALFVNGVARQFSNPIPSNINVNYNGFGGSFIQYLEKDDEVQPGYVSTFNASGFLEADAGGTATYWSGSFLGNKRPS